MATQQNAMTSYLMARRQPAQTPMGQPTAHAASSGAPVDFSQWIPQQITLPSVGVNAPIPEFAGLSEGMGLQGLVDLDNARRDALKQAGGYLYNADKTYRMEGLTPTSSNIQHLDPATGRWSTASGIPSAEEAQYQWVGVNDPRYLAAVKNAASTTDKFDDWIVAHPGALGQLDYRAQPTSPDWIAYSKSPSAYWSSYAPQLKAAGLNVSPQQEAVGAKWSDYMSPGSQGSRSSEQEKSGLAAPLSVLAMVAMPYLAPLLGGGILGGAAAGGLLGGGTAAVTGGDIGKGALIGGIGGGLGGALGGLEGGANFVGPVNPSSMIGNTTWQQLAGGALSSAAKAGLSGGDPWQAALGSTLGGGASALLGGAGLPSPLASYGGSLASRALLGGAPTPSRAASPMTAARRPAQQNLTQFLLSRRA